MFNHYLIIPKDNQLHGNPFLLSAHYPALLGGEEKEAWAHLLGMQDNSPAFPGCLICLHHRPSAKKPQLGFL